jgi:HTH-type transcriptional regulator, sugar sensing transcriptional regulator
MAIESGIQAFERLGLTRVEAEVYLHLVQHSPATGYAIAKAIGRTQGATYKVLASLQQRGAVIVDDARTRLCRAIPPDELLRQMEQRFLETKRQAGDAVRGLVESPADDRIYQLTTIEQLYERCHSMLASCSWIAVIDAFPGPLDRLRQDIVSAAGRGVRVAVELYEPAELPGVRVLSHLPQEGILERLPIQWIALSVDGREHLIAALSKDGDRVLQGMWTASLILSWSQLGSAVWAMVAFAMCQKIDQGAPYETIREEYHAWRRHFPMFSSPGYFALRERLGLPPVEPPAGPPADAAGTGHPPGGS